MVKGGQNLPADIIQVIDQLERHCLSPDGSLISKSAYYDLQLAIYCEAIAMVEEYQQAVSVANLGGIRDIQGFYPQLGLKNSPQSKRDLLTPTLEHRLVVAEAAQRLRLPLISKDGEIHEEEIEKWSIIAVTSGAAANNTGDSGEPGFGGVPNPTSGAAANNTGDSGEPGVGGVPNPTSGAAANNTGDSGEPGVGGVPNPTSGAAANNTGDSGEPGVGGVPNRFLGITPAYLPVSLSARVQTH
ncbi:Paternally-expressed gene 3 protein [Gossypium arboreum]|uniref:Paternally-expressed gene 3 protein n=1 Tax=Gossypium arboreum TaxID=29729 RepID=A0A0B0NH79_GOSAR|nr:Paternally-expressed gene 3 protein [Gossypium arboreum]